MKRPGFSISTAIFVAVLLGGVAYVGSMVNPIKPSPEAEHSHDEAEHKETPAATPDTAKKDGTPPAVGKSAGAKADSKERKQFIEGEMQQRRQMYKEIAEQAKRKPNGKANIPLKDPEAIDPTSSHFFQEDMGASGIDKQQAEVAAKKKVYDAAMEKARQHPFEKSALPTPTSPAAAKLKQVP